MAKYQVLNTVNIGFDQTHANIMVAVTAAIQYARMAGHNTLTIRFQTDGATVSQTDGVTLFTIAPLSVRPVGRPPSAKLIEPLEPKHKATCLAFSGRPSATGWLMCGAVCGLLLPTAQQLAEGVEHSAKSTYCLVAADQYGKPLGCTWLPDIAKEAMARAADIPGRRGVSLSYISVALDVALGFIDAPYEGLAAWFLVSAAGGHFLPVARRLASAGGYKAFQSASKVEVVHAGSAKLPAYLASYARALPGDPASDALLTFEDKAPEPRVERAKKPRKPSRTKKATAV
jgi:hypothetical protein